MLDREFEFPVKKDGKKIWIDGRIKLPNSIQIKIQCTAEGQYLEFKEFWLGNIKFPTQTLCSIAENVLESGENEFSIFWNSTRTIKIDIFDKTPVTYHLHWGTKVDIRQIQRSNAVIN